MRDTRRVAQQGGPEARVGLEWGVYLRPLLLGVLLFAGPTGCETLPDKLKSNPSLSAVLSAVRGSPDTAPVVSRLNAQPPGPGTPSDWPAAREAITEATTVLPTVTKTDDVKLVSDALDRVTSSYRNGADAAFAEYDVLSGTSFFDVYPAEIADRPAFLARNRKSLTSRLAAAPASDVRDFMVIYDLLKTPSQKRVETAGSEESYATLQRDLVQAVMAKRGSEGGGSVSSRAPLALKAWAETVSEGLPATVFPDGRPIQVVLLNAAAQRGYGSFAVQTKNGLPVDVADAETLERLPDAYVVLVHVAGAKATEHIQGREARQSRYRSGETQVANPDYEVNKLRMYQAQIEANNIASTPCQGWGCVAQGILGAAAQAVAQKAQQKRYSAPKSYSKPRTQPKKSAPKKSSYSNYTGPRCYAPGGKTWKPC